MKISKTAFKEYAKCNRVYPLENIYIHKLDNNISYFDEENVMEILGHMFDEDTGDDLIVKDDAGLKLMLEYYENVERHAIEIASKKFGEKIEYFKETKKQKSFAFTDESNHNFYCYLDGYLEKENEVIVIEVKATTSKKFKKAGSNKNPLFINEDNIFRINEKADENDRVYINHYKKLFDPLSDTGKYIFDIAVERYIIERSITQKYPELLNKKFKYYLAILNSDYVFNGKYQDGEPLYEDDLINFIDLSKITFEYLPKIDDIKNRIVSDINNSTLPKEVYGKKCGYKSSNECIFFDICFPKLKEKGSIMEYMQAKSFGPNKLKKEDLVNKGIVRLSDIEETWLNNQNQIIQRNCYLEESEHMNKLKINTAIDSLKYPIYHLDFESFPCPLPRYKHESPYSQSLFQYSVHIEKQPGKCSFIEDNYSYLVNDFSDHRRDLVENLIKVIDLENGGTVLVYNKSFEYNRLSELKKMFPEYSDQIMKIQESMFDLIDIVKTNSKLYLELGFDEEESKEVNYYHNDLQGGYSIKRVLPLFSNLSYSDLKVQNGNDAIYSYIKFKHLSKEEIEEIRTDLITYCRQDTWAMFVILEGLRNRIGKKKELS